MTVAQTAYLGKIQTNDGSGAAYVDWTEVYEIVTPDQTTPELDVTHLSSSNMTREYIAGWKDSADITFSQNYVESDYSRALGLKGTSKTWKIHFPDGSILTFSGFIKSTAMTLAVDVMRVTHTIRVSGAVVLT